MTGTLKTALRRWCSLPLRRFGGGCHVAHQRPRQCRGHPPEPADRVWPRRRAGRHRRYAQQHAIHQAIAASHAGAAGREYPRPADPHRQRGRRDGHRQPAAVRHPGHADRRHRLGDGRRQEPARAARCWSRRCLAPTATSTRSPRARSPSAASRPRARRPTSPAACRRSAELPNGAIIEREIDFSLNSLGQLRLALRNPDFTTAKRIAVAINDYHGRAGRRAARSIDRAADAAEETARERGRDAHRHRAAAGRAGRGGENRHRRALRRHRHRPRRARLDGRGGARQPHRHAFPKRRKSASRRRCRAAAPSWCRAPGSACRRKARSSPLVHEGVSLQQIVDGLNALGIGPRDLITILQAIKAAGAIQADIEVM